MNNKYYLATVLLALGAFSPLYRLSFPERFLPCAGACFLGRVLDYFRIVGDIY